MGIKFENGYLCISIDFIKSKSTVFATLGKWFIGSEMTEAQFLAGMGIKPLVVKKGDVLRKFGEMGTFQVTKVEGDYVTGVNSLTGSTFSMSTYGLTMNQFSLAQR